MIPASAWANCFEKFRMSSVTITLSSCPIFVGFRFLVLHHNQSLDVIIRKSECDIIKLIVMQN